MSELQAVERKEVDFQGSKLQAVKTESGNIYVGMQWVVSGIGFDKRKAYTEIDKAKEDEVVSRGVRNFVVPTRGGKQKVKCLNIEFLPIWLAKISITPTIKKEQPDVSWKMTQFQLKAKDVLADAFINQKEELDDDLAMIENLNNQISHVVSHIRKQDKELEETKEKQEKLEERVDSLDAVNLEGDLRQRLNQMVRKYAYESGEGFGKAWSEFKRRFNIAYNTNIELLKTNYQKETGQEISTPGILEERNRLEDAIRVANKMINKAS